MSLTSLASTTATFSSVIAIVITVANTSDEDAAATADVTAVAVADAAEAAEDPYWERGRQLSPRKELRAQKVDHSVCGLIDARSFRFCKEKE